MRSPKLCEDELSQLEQARTDLDTVVPAVLKITRPRADYRSQPGDGAVLRAWKSRQRWRFFYRRNLPQTISVGNLAKVGFDKITADTMVAAVSRLRTDCHELLLEVGRLLTRSEWRTVVDLSRADIDDPEALLAQMEQAKTATLERLDELKEHLDTQVREFGARAADVGLNELRELYTTLQRVDAPILARARQRDKARIAALEGLGGMADQWNERQLAICKRLRVAARVASARSLLTSTTARYTEELIDGTRESGLGALKAVRNTLNERAQAALRGDSVDGLGDELQFDASGAVARFARAAAAATSDLADSESILSDVAAAEAAQGGSLEQVSVPVRSAVQALVELELISRFQTEIARLIDADMRSWAVARDTARHVGHSTRNR